MVTMMKQLLSRVKSSWKVFGVFLLLRFNSWRQARGVGTHLSAVSAAVTSGAQFGSCPSEHLEQDRRQQKSMEKQSFRLCQGLSQIPGFSSKDLYLCSLLHHNMVSQNVCYHSLLKRTYSTYSLVTADTFFLDFAT